MIETSKKYVEVINELKDMAFKELVRSSGTLLDVSETNLKLMMLTLNLVNISNELVMENARLMDEQNEKLDKILENQNEKGKKS